MNSGGRQPTTPFAQAPMKQRSDGRLTARNRPSTLFPLRVFELCADMTQLRKFLPLALLVPLFACKNEVELRTELFTDMCTQIFSCGCQEYPYVDLAQCEEVNAVDYAGIEAAAAAAGVTVDAACLISTFPASKYQCKTESEVYEDEGPTGCAPCSVAYGDVPAGQACLEYDYFDNCAQGLACRRNVCVDPCAPSLWAMNARPGSTSVARACSATTPRTHAQNFLAQGNLARAPATRASTAILMRACASNTRARVSLVRASSARMV